MVDFIAIFVERFLRFCWMAAIMFGIERLTLRSELSVERQLKGTVYAVLLFPIAMGTDWTLGWLAAALNLRPIFDVASIPWLGSRPIPLAFVSVVVGVVLTDFLYYWAHRAQHAIPLLWRFHSLHHSINDLSALNSYAHWTEEAVMMLLKVMPAAILMQLHQGPAGVAVLAVVAFQQVYIHSASRLHFGRWSWLINDNRRHRIHHSIEPRHFNKNFGINLGFWDHLFGTAYVPAPDEWPETGLSDQAEPSTFMRFFGWSFGLRKSVEADNRAVREGT